MSENLEKEIKQENLTWASAWRLWPSSSRPAQPAGGPARLLLCRLRPRQREGSVPGARAPPRHTTSLSACLPSPLLVWMPRRRHTATPTSLALSLALLLSPCSLPRTPERHHRRRSPLPRPPASPRPPPEPRSSASSSASSSTSQVSRDALHRRHRRLLHRRPP